MSKVIWLCKSKKSLLKKKTFSVLGYFSAIFRLITSGNTCRHITYKSQILVMYVRQWGVEEKETLSSGEMLDQLIV